MIKRLILSSVVAFAHPKRRNQMTYSLISTPDGLGTITAENCRITASAGSLSWVAAGRTWGPSVFKDMQRKGIDLNALRITDTDATPNGVNK